MSDENDDRRRMAALIEQGGLGTPRAQQLIDTGHEMSRGSLSEPELLELAMNAMLNMGECLPNYRVDIGERTQRYIKVEESDYDSGSLTIEVWVTGQRWPLKRYRIQLNITEEEA